MAHPELPRQRKGTVPQGRGRFPDYDVLASQDHWDDVTRAAVVARVNDVPPISFFSPEQVHVLQPFVDVVMAQHCEPKIPVLNFIDEKLAQGKRDGYRYFALPDDDEVWRLLAEALAKAGFAEMSLEQQKDYVGNLANAKMHGEPWDRINVAFAWEIIHRDILQSFYSHPWAWNEIGFGGPAYPRGYTRFGIRHLPDSEREEWEGREEVSWDPGHMAEGLDE